MGKLIEDITPAYKRGYGLSRIDTTILVTELAKRGVTIEDIFGMYYALEEQAGHRQDEAEGYSEVGNHGARAGLTVGDAQLAAPALPPKQPLGNM